MHYNTYVVLHCCCIALLKKNFFISVTQSNKILLCQILQQQNDCLQQTTDWSNLKVFCEFNVTRTRSLILARFDVIIQSIPKMQRSDFVYQFSKNNMHPCVSKFLNSSCMYKSGHDWVFLNQIFVNSFSPHLIQFVPFHLNLIRLAVLARN